MISVSFLSSKDIIKTLRKLDDTDTDFIHVDVMDGIYVDNKSLPFKELKHIPKFTDKRLDVHLMVNKPSLDIKNYASLNTEYISIHLDIEEDIISDLKLIKSYGIKSGIVLNPLDSVSDIIPYLPYIDLILVMGVTPGYGEQEFILETVDKLKEVKALKREYKDFVFKISVDGGINDNTVDKVKKYVDILVSGSYIVNSLNYQEKINSLR